MEQPLAVKIEGPTLEDVEDVFAFAYWIADRTFKEDSFVARDEARCEAVALIYELHGDWDPARCAKFSAYLLSYLPRRLISWWRRELRQSGRGNWAGSRGDYVYYRTVSLDNENAKIRQVVHGPGE